MSEEYPEDITMLGLGSPWDVAHLNISQRASGSVLSSGIPILLGDTVARHCE